MTLLNRITNTSKNIGSIDNASKCPNNKRPLKQEGFNEECTIYYTLIQILDVPTWKGFYL